MTQIGKMMTIGAAVGGGATLAGSGVLRAASGDGWERKSMTPGSFALAAGPMMAGIWVSAVGVGVMAAAKRPGAIAAGNTLAALGAGAAGAGIITGYAASALLAPHTKAF